MFKDFVDSFNMDNTPPDSSHGIGGNKVKLQQSKLHTNTMKSE